jgi:hypothetical protein
LPVELLDYNRILQAPVAERMGGWPVVAISATLFSAVNFLSIMGIASGFETEDGIPWSAPRELAGTFHHRSRLNRRLISTTSF